MMFALGAAGSLVDALQSLTSSKASATASANPGQDTANPFDLGGSTQSPVTSGAGGKADVWASISPQTMSALIDAQGQSGATNPAPTSPQDALQDLFSQLDANGDHSISKSEFENALGAGGTNLAAADDVFGKLDTNGDGSVSLDELKNALQGAGGHHGGHHHMHAAHSGSSSDGSTGPNADPLMQALAGASSNAVTNSDGSTTTTITYADGSKVSLTTPAASSSSSTSSSSGSATSSYNWIEQMIQREAKALSASVASSLSVSV